MTMKIIQTSRWITSHEKRYGFDVFNSNMKHHMFRHKLLPASFCVEIIQRSIRIKIANLAMDLHNVEYSY